MRFDLFSLRLFITVCEQQSIARAAEIEHIAASAVSERIADLEEMLKAPLFHRTPKALEPTPSAHALLKHARIVMRDLAQLESQMADHAKGVCGQVRLHASVSTIVQHLPRDLQVFMTQAPGDPHRIGGNRPAARSSRQWSKTARPLHIWRRPAMPGLVVLPYRSDTLVATAPIDHPIAAKPSVNLLRDGRIQLSALKGKFPRPGWCSEPRPISIVDLKMKIQVNGSRPWKRSRPSSASAGAFREHLSQPGATSLSSQGGFGNPPLAVSRVDVRAASAGSPFGPPSQPRMPWRSVAACG